MKIQRTVLAIAVCLVVIGGWAGWTYWWDSGGSQTPPIAAALKSAPRFQLPDNSGKNVKLDDLKGNVVLVHFWASWCPPCVDEMPQVVALAQQFKDRKFKILAVSLDVKWEDALKLLPTASLPPNMISVIDIDQKTSELYGTYQYPESYLLNANLEIVAKLIGGQKWESALVHDAIDKLIPKS